MCDHLLKSLENDHFTPFPSCICPSSFCLSSVDRILEVELYCDCRMPELKTSYFGFPTGDMIECTHRPIISKLTPLIISVVKYVK